MTTVTVSTIGVDAVVVSAVVVSAIIAGNAVRDGARRTATGPDDVGDEKSQTDQTHHDARYGKPYRARDESEDQEDEADNRCGKCQGQHVM